MFNIKRWLDEAREIGREEGLEEGGEMFFRIGYQMGKIDARRESLAPKSYMEKQAEAILWRKEDAEGEL